MGCLSLENKEFSRYIINMKKTIIKLNLIVIIILVSAAQVYPQTDYYRIAPGAKEQLANLLNNPAMVTPVTAVPLGRNWFKLETDTHIFTDKVSVRQVAGVFLDFDQASVYEGKKGKLIAKRVSVEENGQIVDFIPITMVIGFQVRTQYRALVKIDTFTDTKCLLDMKQIQQDSETNRRVKNLIAPKYIEEVTIDGKNYTYIRIYTLMDVDASILPGAKNVLERNSGPTNEEALLLVIEAAKKK